MTHPLTREEVEECRQALASLESQGLIRRDGTGYWRSAGQSDRRHRILTGIQEGTR